MKAWKLSSLALALTTFNSYAVEPIGIALGSGITFLPSADLDIESNTNIYSTPDDEVSDVITRIAPTFIVEADFGKTKAGAYYKVEQGFYGEDKNDDYLDHNFKAGMQHEFSSRQELTVDASFNDAHDPRGSGTVEGNAAAQVDPDEYEELAGGLSYIYGADSSTGNITVFADSYQKRYSNNKTFGTLERDHDKFNFGATLALIASPDAEVILEARQTNISYSKNTPTANAREGYEQRMFAGMRWDMTGATSGEFKLGRSSRFFDERSVASNVRVAWEANLTWEPLTYSTVKLSSSQSSNETNGAGDYIANTFSSANWVHEFSTYYTAGMNVSINSDVYVSDSSNREDDLLSYGIDGTYSPLNWIDVSLSYTHANRNSNNSAFDYQSQLINFGLTVAL